MKSPINTGNAACTTFDPTIGPPCIDDPQCDDEIDCTTDFCDHEIAGFADWRLPTLEELASLMEPRGSVEGWFINSIFDTRARNCLSADIVRNEYENDGGSFAYSSFSAGRLSYLEKNLLQYHSELHIRAVRSMKVEELSTGLSGALSLAAQSGAPQIAAASEFISLDHGTSGTALVVAAAALFSSVETWVRQKGMTFMRGPLSPSTNYETGLLIEGFNYPPVLMMTYNPPYYPRLVESCGFTKEKDLLAFLIDNDYRLPEWMDRLAEKITHKKGVHIRRFRPKEEDAEFALIREIYNESWSANWGFVPLSENEMKDIQKNVMEFTDPDLGFSSVEIPQRVTIIEPNNKKYLHFI
jgi:hypothetical protein